MDIVTYALAQKAIKDTVVQSDWNQNDSTAADYVKNRPFYGETSEMVLIEERTIPFEEGQDQGIYMAEFPSTFKATVGETYKVTWDGSVYECICTEFDDLMFIGNSSLADEGIGPDTGEPFLIVSDNRSIMIGTLDTSASHTISISGYIESVVKINPKYLPMASETEPGIVAFGSLANSVLQQVKDKYFTPTVFSISGYGDSKVIEECADKNNGYGIFVPGEKFGGAVLSCYNYPNKYITSVLSGGANIKCYKFLQGASSAEQLWGISEDGVIISSSTTNSTKKFKITVDDSGTISATEVT